MDSEFLCLVGHGFRIPIFSRIPDSLSKIPKSKALDGGFHKEKFPGFRNPDNLTCGDWWLHSFFSFDVIVMQLVIQRTCHFIVN